LITSYRSNIKRVPQQEHTPGGSGARTDLASEEVVVAANSADLAVAGPAAEALPETGNSSAHRFLHKCDNLRLFGRSQFLQSKRDRPHITIVQAGTFLETKDGVSVFKFTPYPSFIPPFGIFVFQNRWTGTKKRND